MPKPKNDILQGTLALNMSRSGGATPLAFNSTLAIGDNRDNEPVNERARVVLLARVTLFL